MKKTILCVFLSLLLGLPALACAASGTPETPLADGAYLVGTWRLYGAYDASTQCLHFFADGTVKGYDLLPITEDPNVDLLAFTDTYTVSGGVLTLAAQGKQYQAFSFASQESADGESAVAPGTDGLMLYPQDGSVQAGYYRLDRLPFIPTRGELTASTWYDNVSTFYEFYDDGRVELFDGELNAIGSGSYALDDGTLTMTLGAERAWHIQYRVVETLELDEEDPASEIVDDFYEIIAPAFFDGYYALPLVLQLHSGSDLLVLYMTAG